MPLQYSCPPRSTITTQLHLGHEDVCARPWNMSVTHPHATPGQSFGHRSHNFSHKANTRSLTSSVLSFQQVPLPSFAARRKGCGVVVLVILLLASPVNGYDRGGPQHSITWGRANSPSSAVFATLPTNVTAVKGHHARLPCQVTNIDHKDVSWIRKRDLHILTVGIFTYTTDDRFKVYHPPESDNWDLDISSVTLRDSGVYECQVSTSPKVSLPILLTVLGQQAAVIQGPGEVYVQRGSTISLECRIPAGPEVVGAVAWYRGHHPLNYSSPRGGISMEVEKTPSQTTSKLHITRAVRQDSGNYTCRPKLAKPSTVTVHVVTDGEESAAAVQSGCDAARVSVVALMACAGAVWAWLGVVCAALQHLLIHPAVLLTAPP